MLLQHLYLVQVKPVTKQRILCQCPCLRIHPLVGQGGEKRILYTLHLRRGCTLGMRSDCRAVITSREVMLASYSCAQWQTMELMSCLVISRQTTASPKSSPEGKDLCAALFPPSLRKGAGVGFSMRSCSLSEITSCLKRLCCR